MKKEMGFILILSLTLLVPEFAFAYNEHISTFELLISGPFGSICMAVFGLIGLACFLFSGGDGNGSSAAGMILTGSVCLILTLVIYFNRVDTEFDKLKGGGEPRHYDQWS